MDWVKHRAERLKAEAAEKNKTSESARKTLDPLKKTPESVKKTPDPAKKTLKLSNSGIPAGPEKNMYEQASNAVQRMALQLEPQIMGIREILHGLDRDVKVIVKRNFVNNGKYRSHCLEFVGAGLTYQDRVFQFFVVCLADIGDWDEFFKFVDVAVHLKQTPEPSFIKKNFEEFRAWVFHDWAVAEQRAKRDPDADGFVTQILEQPERLPESVVSVLMAMKFKSLMAAGKEKDALDYGLTAMEKGAQIKTAWYKLEKSLVVEDAGEVGAADETSPGTTKGE